MFLFICRCQASRPLGYRGQIYLNIIVLILNIEHYKEHSFRWSRKKISRLFLKRKNFYIEIKLWNKNGIFNQSVPFYHSDLVTCNLNPKKNLSNLVKTPVFINPHFIPWILDRIHKGSMPLEVFWGVNNTPPPSCEKY